MQTPPLILIVDDDPIFLETLQDLLTTKALAVATVASGAAALEYLKENEPDIILLDVMMPEMDGFTLCRRIRQNPAWQHLPIILVTALNDKEDLLRGLMVGADEFLSKPIDTSELTARILSMLRIKRQHDELQSILQMRKDMVHMILHDIRNPLNAIIMHSSLLAESQVPPTNVANAGKTILHLARRVEEFANDLLLTAKMEQGALVPDLRPVNVEKVLTRQVSYLLPKLEALQLNLQMDLPEQPYTIYLDEYLFTRAVDNLLSNAVKHSPNSSQIHLVVRYPLQTDPQQAVMTLSVIDEGPGVPAESRDTIFGKFHTLRTSSADGRSIGLGLAFCKMVAEIHCGHIIVSDQQPHGANFTMAFWVENANNQ